MDDVLEQYIHFTGPTARDQGREHCEEWVDANNCSPTCNKKGAQYKADFHQHPIVTRRRSDNKIIYITYPDAKGDVVDYHCKVDGCPV